MVDILWHLVGTYIDLLRHYSLPHRKAKSGPNKQLLIMVYKHVVFNIKVSEYVFIYYNYNFMDQNLNLYSSLVIKNG